jgi:hypothetical protein
MLGQAVWRRVSILGVALLTVAGQSAVAAPFNVYYRADAGSPWVFYSGAGTRPAADRVVVDLTALGYLAEVVTDNGPAPGGGPGGATAAVPQAGPTYVSGSTYYPPTYYGAPGGSYSYSFGGPGYSWSSHTWHHYDYDHRGQPEGRQERIRHEPRPHPTPQPLYRHRARAHPAHRAVRPGGRGGRGGGHHGGHHQHSHVHAHHRR